MIVLYCTVLAQYALNSTKKKIEDRNRKSGMNTRLFLENLIYDIITGIEPKRNRGSTRQVKKDKKGLQQDCNGLVSVTY